MAKTRREFTPEFKREAVALLESSGRPQMQIAADLAGWLWTGLIERISQDRRSWR